MSENRFAPDLKPYKDIGQFRFWCQKVLPLVYDDSLSYYELLCKVVNYLNDVIANSGVEEENIAKLLIAYKELEDYVFEKVDPAFFEQIEEEFRQIHSDIKAIQDLNIANKFDELDNTDKELAKMYVQLKEELDSFDLTNWKNIVNDKLEELGEEDSKLWEAYNELKDYLDNINWTELVSDKIDELVEKGILTGIEIATADRLGGIKVGENFDMDSVTGVMNVKKGTGITQDVDGGVAVNYGKGIELDEVGRLTAKSYELIDTMEKYNAVTRKGESVVETFLLKQLLQEGANEYTELHIHTTEESLISDDVVVKAELIYNVEGLTETVTGKFDDSGYCNLRVHNIGTYRVSATDDEGTWFQDVVVASFTVIVVNIAKFKATISVDVGGGADVTGQTINVKATGGGKTYNSTFVGRNGNISVGTGNTDYTISATITDSTGNDAHSNEVNVRVEGEGSYDSPIMSFARIEIEAIFNENATATLSNGTISHSYSFTQSGQKVGEYVDIGIWNLHSEVDGVESDTSFTVDEYSVYSTQITGSVTPDGKEVLPTDDVTIWLKCASIFDVNYTTLSQVLNDQVTFNALIQSENACEYMKRSTTWASTISGNVQAITLVGLNEYCSRKLLENDTWFESFYNSTNYEKIFTDRIPSMTDNTTPSGEAFSSGSTYGATVAYRVFDGDDNSYDAGNATNNYYAAYDFGKVVSIAYTTCITVDVTDYKLQVSDNKTVWTDVVSYSGVAVTQTAKEEKNKARGRYIRILPSVTRGNGHFLTLQVKYR